MAANQAGSDGLYGVYWVGQNGNIYTQGNNGQVQSLGKSLGTSSTGFDAANGSSTSYRQIADPNAPAAAPSRSNNAVLASTGNASATQTPSAAQTAPLLASLASLDAILGNKNAASTAEHDKAIAGYNAQDALDKQAIDQSRQQNEGNYTAGNQAALLNAANASTGLRGLLSSLGGLSGSGVNVVKKLVGLAANSDTGSARQTFDTNATNLSQSAAQTTQQEKQRRDDAEATLANNLQNNQANVLNSKQSIYQSLASLFGPNTAQGDSYGAQAGALAAPIAATTKATVAPYASASSLYSPAALATYLAGTQKLNASASGGASTATTPINAPGYPTKKDSSLTGVA